jgi:hypothetical protein
MDQTLELPFFILFYILWIFGRQKQSLGWVSMNAIPQSSCSLANTLNGLFPVHDSHGRLGVAHTMDVRDILVEK